MKLRMPTEIPKIYTNTGECRLFICCTFDFLFAKSNKRKLVATFVTLVLETDAAFYVVSSTSSNIARAFLLTFFEKCTVSQNIVKYTLYCSCYLYVP